MKPSYRRPLAFAGLLFASLVHAQEVLPWTFGMSLDEVRAVSAFGPYRAFSNGDLETYKGPWDGKDENVQFYFTAGHLHRISYCFYEGTDPGEAATRWAVLRSSMQRHFGPLETPGNDAKATAQFQAVAQTSVSSGARNFMTPVSPTKDKPVFAIFKREQIQGQWLYFVTLHFDPPP